ncbi:MAG: hypothetical protein MR304_11610 [Eubacterium sp.]|nr:hypothetical protein [Eubacterium sp.]
MIELFEQDIQLNDRQSSKGNQLKWQGENGVWYKADYTGYEGFVEYMVSCLLEYSSLEKDEYVSYQTEKIHYKYRDYLGCKSVNFLPEGWKIITLERLFDTMKGESLTKNIYHMQDVPERIQYMVEQTEELTGLSGFGAYISKLMTIDALFLNEDRHTHNIAVLLDESDQFHYCPIFDNGASLLSDTIQDYPMNQKIETLTGQVKAKTFCDDFDEQLDAVEELYGRQIQFHYNREIVENVIEKENNYSNEVKDRVYYLVTRQMKKYQYLFC